MYRKQGAHTITLATIYAATNPGFTSITASAERKHIHIYIFGKQPQMYMHTHTYMTGIYTKRSEVLCSELATCLQKDTEPHFLRLRSQQTASKLFSENTNNIQKGLRRTLFTKLHRCSLITTHPFKLSKVSGSLKQKNALHSNTGTKACTELVHCAV